MKKLFLALICLLPIPIAAEAYEEAVAVQMGMGFASFIAWLLILILQKDIKEYKQLSIVLFIGKMAGHAVAGVKFLKYVSGDGESEAIILAIAMFAAVGFIVEYVIGYFFSRKLKRNNTISQ